MGRIAILPVIALIANACAPATPFVATPLTEFGVEDVAIGEDSPEDLQFLMEAFREAQDQEDVREATKAEIMRQLMAAKPVAFIRQLEVEKVVGYWITPIDLSLVYGNPVVNEALLTTVAGTSAEILLEDLIQNPLDHLSSTLGWSVTPGQFTDELLGDLVKNLDESLAGVLFETNVTEFGPLILILVGFGVGVAASLTANYLYERWTAPSGIPPTDPNTGLPLDHPDADPDGDGVPNDLDGDDDGDGTPDDEDDYPYDPGESICFECPYLSVTTFTDDFSIETTGTVSSAFQTAIQSYQAGATVSLGSAIQDQDISVEVAFPLGGP